VEFRPSGVFRLGRLDPPRASNPSSEDVPAGLRLRIMATKTGLGAVASCRDDLDIDFEFLAPRPLNGIAETQSGNCRADRP